MKIFGIVPWLRGPPWPDRNKPAKISRTMYTSIVFFKKYLADNHKAQSGTQCMNIKNLHYLCMNNGTGNSYNCINLKITNQKIYLTSGPIGA